VRYRVELKPSAKRGLRDLPSTAQARVAEALDLLAANPRPPLPPTIAFTRCAPSCRCV